MDDLLLAEGGRDQEDSGCGPMDDALPAPAGFARSAPPLHPSSLILHPSGGFGSPVGVLLSYAMAAVIFGAGAMAALDLATARAGATIGPRNDALPSRGPRRRRPADCREDHPIGRLRLGRSECGGREETGVALDSCHFCPRGPARDHLQHGSDGC